MHARTRGLLAGLAAIVVVAAGCAGDDGPATTATTLDAGDDVGTDPVEEGTPHDGGTLTIGLPSLTNAAWHPVKDNWETGGHLVGSAVFETLMAYGPDGEIVNWLAESLEPNDDLTVWTVTLRDGVTFHDGQPMNAEAVQRSAEAAMTEGLGSIAFEGAIDGVVEVDDRTVELRLTRPTAVVPQILAGVGGIVVAPSMLENTDETPDPVGTGAFVFESWDGATFRAVRNDNYWRTDTEGEQLPYLEGIEYRVIDDPASRRSALSAGEVDMIVTTNADDIADARDDTGVVSVEDNFTEETFVMLNVSDPPFDNPHAREALAYGTDPEAVVSVTQGDVALPASSPFAPGTAWAVDDPGYVEYDPDRAREAVEAYEADTGEPLAFAFDGIPVSDTLQQQQLLVQGWEELGIDASIESLEPVAYLTSLISANYQAAWFRNYAYNDPLYLYVFFHSRFANADEGTLSTNFSQVANPELDTLLEDGLATPDPAQRKAIYDDAVSLINDELADVWLFHTPWALIASPEVRGLNHPRATGFAAIEPKVWIPGLWLDPG